MIDAPSDGAPEQAPSWALVDTESYDGGIRVLAPSLAVWGYVGIYRRKEYIGASIGGPRGWGRAWGGRARPLPRGLLLRALLPLLSLGEDTARSNPKLSTSPMARTTNLVGQTKRII